MGDPIRRGRRDGELIWESGWRSWFVQCWSCWRPRCWDASVTIAGWNIQRSWTNLRAAQSGTTGRAYWRIVVYFLVEVTMRSSISFCARLTWSQNAVLGPMLRWNRHIYGNWRIYTQVWIYRFILSPSQIKGTKRLIAKSHIFQGRGNMKKIALVLLRVFPSWLDLWPVGKGKYVDRT